MVNAYLLGDQSSALAADSSVQYRDPPALRGTLSKLAFLDLPVVAAVNGHAIAGGFVLLAAADRAVMAEGRGRIGTTELLIDIRDEMSDRRAHWLELAVGLGGAGLLGFAIWLLRRPESTTV